jgi:hypothetical protein
VPSARQFRCGTCGHLVRLHHPVYGE